MLYLNLVLLVLVQLLLCLLEDVVHRRDLLVAVGLD